MATWLDDKILELANQLTYSPAEKRREQLRAAMDLVAGVESTKEYPWDYVHFRITGFAPRFHVEHVLPGKVLKADLATLIEFLSDTLAITVEEAERERPGDLVLTMEEVSRKFTVSMKTIQRWRKQGLIALKFVYPDGRRRLGFLESSAKEFAALNKERVEKSAAFKQLSDEERSVIIKLARKLAAKRGTTIKEIALEIGGLLHRSPEAVRYTIRKYDRDHPEAAIFGETNEVALFALHPAAPEPAISSFHMVINERVKKLQSLKIEFITNPLFEHPDADTIVLKELPEEAMARAHASVAAGTQSKAKDLFVTRAPGGLPAYLQEVFSQPVMPAELERDAFRRMNYLKFKASRLQKGLDEREATPTELADIETLLVQANEIKNELVQSNLRIAVHVARKHQRLGQSLMEVVSDATIWLMRAVEKYDFSRGGTTKFSTYASYAIMKNFARHRAEALTQRDMKLVTGQEEVINAIGAREEAAEADAAALKGDLQSVIQELPERERELLTQHYGLVEGKPALSLAEIGDKMGITKARVRQLEARALRTLRKLMEARGKTLGDAAAKETLLPPEPRQ